MELKTPCRFESGRRYYLNPCISIGYPDITALLMTKYKLIVFLSLFFVIILNLAWIKPIPRLFVIGDSISIQYGPYLESYLDGIVAYERKRDDGNAEANLDVPTGANGGDSRMVLAYLRAKLQDPNFKPDFLMLNCGLHDIKREPESNQIQVEKNEYRQNLELIIELLHENNIRILWIRTTPVVDRIHNHNRTSFHRYSADLKEYNQIADEVFIKHEIPMIDLHGFTEHLGEEAYIDHVHFSESARNLQASFLAGYLASYIQKNFHR